MALSNVNWKGMKALEVMLDVLPTKIAKSRVTRAYKYALEPTKKKMLQNIPNDRTGNLKYSIDTTVSGTQQLQQAWAIIGPRRKRNTWNMQGWHAHIIEKGAKEHNIPQGVFTRFLGAKKMPVFTKAGFTGTFARQIHHKGVTGTYPFQRAIDSTWATAADRVSNKIADIMNNEIKIIWAEYGNVVTKSQI